MKLALSWTVALATILSAADASAVNRDVKPKVSTTTQCATLVGPHRLPSHAPTWMVSTTSVTKVTSTVVKNIVKTVTPHAITTTKTKTLVSTVVENLQFEDVFTSTITDSTTKSVTSHTTTTVVVTDTQFVSRDATRTIRTPAGFTPLASSLPQSEDAGDDGGDDGGDGENFDTTGDGENQKRDQGELVERDSSWTKNGKSQDVSLSANHRMPGYPQEVTCTVTVYKTILVQTNTVVNWKTTTLPASTITRSTTKTLYTTTTSLYEPASSTETVHVTKTYTTTITDLSTSTSTIPTTSTIITGTVTSYSVCATNNVLGSFEGNGFVGLVMSAQNFATSFQDFQVASGEECCVLAATRMNVWYYQFSMGTCRITFSSEGCGVPDNDVKYGHVTLTTVYGAIPSPIVVGNGACGVIDNIVPAPTVT